MSLRESCMRENRTCSLSGGRRPARKRASSDPTPMKPGNSGEGKGPQLEVNATSDDEREIGDEPKNPGKYSEVADGVTRESVMLPPRAVCGKSARFDKRGVETGHGAANEAPADERAGNS